MGTRKQLVYLGGVMIMIAAIAVGIALAGDFAVDINSKEGTGNYLVDSRGMTLYVFKNDPFGKSTCTGWCADNWPAFYAAEVTTSGDLDKTNFSTITRDDGRMQTAYKGMPLYYFVQDTVPGDTKGNGLKGMWSVVLP